MSTFNKCNKGKKGKRKMKKENGNIMVLIVVCVAIIVLISVVFIIKNEKSNSNENGNNVENVYSSESSNLESKNTSKANNVISKNSSDNIISNTYTSDDNDDISDNDNEIPDNYIAVFNGGAGEITYSTYIYKIDNGRDNYGFKYINTTNTTESYGSPNLIKKVTKKGEVSWSDEVFEVAEDNCAYSYVQLPNDNKTYTIEEFSEMFITN